MPLFHNKYRIESARLASWDYSWPGWYYVTIVVGNRLNVFGKVVNGKVHLSPLGVAADKCWKEIHRHNGGVELDDNYVVMPNHVHGIIILNDARDEDGRRRDVQLNVSTDNIAKSKFFQRISPKKRSLPVVVRTYKAAVTTWARRNGSPEFRWQERFHDHIIRNEADLHRIREYIVNNPLQWSLDKENSDNTAER